MFLSQQNQREEQNIQLNQSSLQTQRDQQPVVSQPFFKKIQQVRKVTDLYRKDLFAKLDEICKFLQQNPDFKSFKGKLNATAVILAEKDAVQLVEVMKQLEYHLQEFLEEKDIQLNQTEFYLQNSQGQLQNLEKNLEEKQIQYQTSQEELYNKNDTILILKRELFELNDYYNTKKAELQQLKAEHDQFQLKKLIKMERNWAQETSYIRELIKEKIQAKNQAFKVQKVKQLLQVRIQELQKVSKELEDNKKQNYIYLGQNIGLNKKINYEKARKENLLETKKTSIFTKQLSVAGQIAQKWDLTEKSAQNFMFEIIQKINSNLHAAQLKDIQKIIESAEEFYNRGGKSARIQNIQHQLQEKTQNHEKEI